MEIAAPIQIIEMPHMKKIKLNSRIRYLSTFAQLARPILLFLRYFFSHNYKEEIKQWSDDNGFSVLCGERKGRVSHEHAPRGIAGEFTRRWLKHNRMKVAFFVSNW